MASAVLSLLVVVLVPSFFFSLSPFCFVFSLSHFLFGCSVVRFIFMIRNDSSVCSIFFFFFFILVFLLIFPLAFCL